MLLSYMDSNIDIDDCLGSGRTTNMRRNRNSAVLQCKLADSNAQYLANKSCPPTENADMATHLVKLRLGRKNAGFKQVGKCH